MPRHLVVLVNGLWGWQRDWHYMRRALEAGNDGSYLIHVSAVNVGAQTYAGVDVCGQRLAHEVLQVVGNTPHLTTISFIGHSMGGLIARYAIGLLADPAAGTVAGLQACWYISIATPHLGCSSSHADEVHWQDRPYMRWLAAAVAAGHLGGHQHLATTAAAAAAAAAGATSPAAAAAAGAAPAAGAAAASCDSSRSASPQPELPQQQKLQQSCKEGNSRRSSSSSNGGSSGVARGFLGGRCWPWTPCRSVVQLLGCDSWQPPTVVWHSSSSSYSSHNGCPGQQADVTSTHVNGGLSHGSGCNSNSRGPSSSSNAVGTLSACRATSSDCIVNCDASGGVAVSAAAEQASRDDARYYQPRSRHGDAACYSCCSTPCLKFGSVLSGPMAARRCSSHCSGSLNCADSADLSGAGQRGGGCMQQDAEEDNAVQQAAAGSQHLLDVLCHDVLLECSSCRIQRCVSFLSGLGMFQHRATYSSAGGDHLIPWTSSSMLTPTQLPVRATKQAATSAAANPSQHVQLPVLGLLATKPAIVEQPLQAATPAVRSQKSSGLPVQQQQQAASHHGVGQDLVTAANAHQGVAEHQGDGSGGLEAWDSPAGTGVLAGRLAQLQGLDWRRFHVVWPRLCLGSSHCNIQYNGPLNFVGQAVVEHVCHLVLEVQSGTRQ